MFESSYEFLSAQDSSFLAFETRNTHMNVGAIAVFEAAPLMGPSGGLDIECLRSHVAARLRALPRYRQRLEFTPIRGRAIWVDDARFNLHYHVRHTSLPRSGGETELKELAGGILSQQLDRHKPLWELWFVEGLEGGRFAMIAKVHHCMVDGVAGERLLTALLSPAPSSDPAPNPPWVPRPAPNRFELLLDEAIRNAGAPFRALRALGEAAARPRETSAELTRTATAVWQAIRAGFRLVANTPLNRPIGPRRSIEWHAIDLEDVRALKKDLDGTVNDVVLAVVTGAVRRFLRSRRWNLKRFDFRTVVPVNMRAGAKDDAAANRVSAWFISLPVGERDPLRRFRKVRKETEQLKHSRAAHGTDLMIRFGDWLGSRTLVDAGTRFTSRLHPYHLIVTNVAGPQIPLYLLEARLLGLYPQLPLFEHQGVAVAVMSYLGKLGFGVIGDPDLIPDLAAFGQAIRESFEELREAAVKTRAVGALYRGRKIMRLDSSAEITGHSGGGRTRTLRQAKMC